MTPDEASDGFRTACKFCVNVGKLTEIVCKNLMRINLLSAKWGKDTHLGLSK